MRNKYPNIFVSKIDTNQYIHIDKTIDTHEFIHIDETIWMWQKQKYLKIQII